MDRLILQKLTVCAAAFALWLGMVGCNTEPLEVVGPDDLRRETGNALISAQVPPFARGLIQRVRLRVTAADSGPIRAIERDLNFPIPGGNQSVGQVADIPIGRRRFTILAFDTEGILRFRGVADSTISAGETELVQVNLGRIGGSIDFKVVIDLATVDTSRIDSTTLAGLPATSMLDILELLPVAHHTRLSMLPLLSAGLGDQFSLQPDGTLSRSIQVSQIPTGHRRFVAHLRDLSSAGTRAFADTITAGVDTVSVTEAVFLLKSVASSEGLLEVFNKTTLPRDSSVVVVAPVF
ncbi:MAG: hypothetical protein QGG64_27545 [Candidatus Latescibacteria bacterium]|jgi:hypothetical protein|nr:hypothetical protein [Candidatus Latescibacterota bacterium]